MNTTDEDRFHTVVPPSSVNWQRRAIRILVAIALILVGVIAAKTLIATAPKTKKRPPVKWIPLVEVHTFAPDRHQVVVKAMGTVMPAKSVKLEARVAGQVLAIHPEFVDGGFVKKGDVLVQLEEDDLRLVLAQRKSELVNAKYALALEQGRQQVAQREWQLLNDGNVNEQEADLALRKPHLQKAQADVAAAQAALQKAELDLRRTRVIAPFNAIVRSRSVETGSQVSPQESLAELIGTDTYWIQATLAVDRLDWISIPQGANQEGALAKITYSAGHAIEGRVVRLLGDLTDQGRMAKIIVAVNDPLGRTASKNHRPPLLIGEYVGLQILGRHLDNVFSIPRTALRDNDTVWLLDGQNKLEIRGVMPVWRDTDHVLLRNNLKPGDRLVVSDLAAPVVGMELRVDDAKASKNQPDKTSSPQHQDKDNG